MKLDVKLFATFRKNRFDRAELECDEGSDLAALIERLGISPSEIGVVLVGGRHAELKHRPAAGDTVSIFPLLGGG